jgi:hypothetical protein
MLINSEIRKILFDRFSGKGLLPLIPFFKRDWQINYFVLSPAFKMWYSRSIVIICVSGCLFVYMIWLTEHEQTCCISGNNPLSWRSNKIIQLLSSRIIFLCWKLARVYSKRLCNNNSSTCIMIYRNTWNWDKCWFMVHQILINKHITCHMFSYK